MRVLFLSLYPDTAASPRYRITQFLPYLRANGLDCTVLSALSARQYHRLTGPSHAGRAAWYHVAETPRRLKQILTARRYDVVFVQKAIMSAYLRGCTGLLRRCARRLVYDLDDAVHLAPPHPLRGLWRILEDRRQIEKIMGEADLVLAGNNWLASAAEAASAKAVRFPTVVDTERFVPGAEASGYCIGWVGNPSTVVCLAPALDALAALEKAEIHLVGVDKRRAPWPWARLKPWRLDTEVADLQALSVGIMPMPKEEWMRGKCALKALLYMACGVPVVASPFGAALEIIEDGVNGLFADSTAAWANAFERLRDPTERRRLAKAGRKTVEEAYALPKAAPRLLKLLESIV